ncbi:hypothetical protein ACFO9E_16435 [Streptomyces maoxianensis]|uniref:Uncharacterized protein n=1 Tax=Streptomyces maoxianensis TaxID=1459942 RepID=A0ABV9G8H8_9ACTN
MSDLEQQLRSLFTEDSTRAPRARSLAEDTVRRVRRHRRAQLAWSAATSAAALAVGVLLVGGLPGEQQQPDNVARPTAPPRSSPTDSTASCAGTYSNQPRTTGYFAVDGTVTAVHPYRPPVHWAHPLPMVVVTMTVHEWFTGGSGTTTHITMLQGIARRESLTPGTRLLIASHRPPNSGGLGDDCGRHLPYDRATADAWRAAWTARSIP